MHRLFPNLGQLVWINSQFTQLSRKSFRPLVFLLCPLVFLFCPLTFLFCPLTFLFCLLRTP
jgi:hypothetical protein